MAEGRSRGRRLAWGLAAGAAGILAAWAGQRAAVRRLRSHQDPEAGVDLGELPPEDLGTVRSFDGTEIAVRADGPADAPVVVFSHGITLDMTTWHYQWEGLSDRYRCVMFDHRSHGRSGRPPTGDHSLRAMGEDIRAVLDHVAPDGPAAVVGHSMGGMALLALAEAHPQEFGERITAVVMADTAASDLLRESMGDLGARLERATRPLVRWWTEDRGRVDRVRDRIARRDLAVLIAWATNFGPRASPTQVEYVARLGASAPYEVWVDSLRALLEMDLRHAIESVSCPALVVVGDRDLITPKTSARALRAALPDGRAIVITRAGHLSMMEQHVVFNDVVGGFLDETLGKAVGRVRGRGGVARGAEGPPDGPNGPPR